MYIGARFQLSIQLGQRHNGQVQLPGKRFDGSGYFGDFQIPAIIGNRAFHELKIINDDHSQIMFLFQSSGFCPDCHGRYFRRVVNVNRRFGKDPGGVREPLPVIIAEKAIPQPRRIDSGLGAKHPHRKLLFGHFQGKYGAGNIVVDSGVSNNIQGQGGFSHTRTRRQNDQIRALKSGRQMIQPGKTSGHAGQKSFITLAFFQLINILINQGADVIEGRLDLVFGNFENSGFRKIQDIVNLTLINQNIDKLEERQGNKALLP